MQRAMSQFPGLTTASAAAGASDDEESDQEVVAQMLQVRAGAHQRCSALICSEVLHLTSSITTCRSRPHPFYPHQHQGHVPFCRMVGSTPEQVLAMMKKGGVVFFARGHGEMERVRAAVAAFDAAPLAKSARALIGALVSCALAQPRAPARTRTQSAHAQEQPT